MPTTKIMLIRHAEKPNGDGGPGLMPDGAQNPEALTALGWTRANALVGLFAPANEAGPRPPLARPSQPVRLGIAKPAAEADDRAAGRVAQPPRHDLPEGSGGSARRCGQGRRRPGACFLAARGDSRDCDADPGPGRRRPAEFGPAIASTSSGCSILGTMGLGASPRRRSSFCRGTWQSRSAGMVRSFSSPIKSTGD